eukprot:COSAG02_NODE_3059_length_7451_cov_11.870919_7_plen_66_part_00
MFSPACDKAGGHAHAEPCGSILDLVYVNATVTVTASGDSLNDDNHDVGCVCRRLEGGGRVKIQLG